ncbi:WAT1-related protein [Tripterygium wilfordii]|uniref:WAT1-related protein n=1 Tax=Tripterygium wilfordii TaxID=458696 RepID=A0A7J7CD11_TRIWF|nr:WAT1-related protein At1g25270 [Tripterygium wilfordii]KAF5731980.1 WAT1-related protein [Tripterygium wilfordii]
MREMGAVLEGLKPGLVMVVVQLSFAGANVFYKLAASDGMNLRVIVAYRFIFATAFMTPLALIFERNKRPKLTWIVLFQSFLCGLFGGALAQNLYVESLALTSATFASAMANLIPAITLIFAIAFGMETLGIGTVAGKAKVLGILIGISGAMLLTFYKGVDINIWSTHVDLLSHPQRQVASGQHGSSRVLGSLLAVASCFAYAIWLTVQSKLSARYPCHYSSTALMSMMGAIQAVIFAVCTERDWSQWKLGWNIRLLSVAFLGIVASGVAVALIAWCVRLRGPVFVSIFNPLVLVLVLVAIAGSLLLDEKLHLGSVLGAFLIVCGLYVVLWGKAKETKKVKTQLPIGPSKSSLEAQSIDIVIAPSTLENDDDNNVEKKKGYGDLLEKENVKDEKQNITT